MLTTMGFDEQSMKILIAATRANQRYASQDRNDIRADFDTMAESFIGDRLLRQSARADIKRNGNEFSPRNWSPRSRTHFQNWEGRSVAGSRRLSFAE